MAAISPEQWQEVSPYLDHALSLSQEDRNAWLESFSAERPDLAGLMQKLLEHHLVAAQESYSRTATVSSNYCVHRGTDHRPLHSHFSSWPGRHGHGLAGRAQ